MKGLSASFAELNNELLRSPGNDKHSSKDGKDGKEGKDDICAMPDLGHWSAQCTH